MNTPVFLTLEEVIQLHREALERFGGAEGVRDMGAIQSAVSMPQQAFSGQYLHADLPAMAAAYLFHLTKNHGFIDGNKRIGARAAAVFLGVNGHEINWPIDQTETLVLGVATGEVTKEQVAEFIRKLVAAAAEALRLHRLWISIKLWRPRVSIGGNPRRLMVLPSPMILHDAGGNWNIHLLAAKVR